MSIVRSIASRIGDTERAGESKDHDQAENDFRDTINRIQHALGGLNCFGRHGLGKLDASYIFMG